MTYSQEQRLNLRRNCGVVFPGFHTDSPADEFRRMADWCAVHDVVPDIYGDGKLIGDFERKIADLLGKSAAAFMPSGMMAQLCALLIWTRRAGLPRFGMHPTSHLAHHEQEAYQALFQFHGVPVGDRLRPLLAADLDAVRQPLACLLVELPIREAGGQLPSWPELQALKDLAERRKIPLHLDGARLWESRAFFGKSHAEIADGFGSVYVSLYKGIGGLAGAILAGDEDFIAEARLWRRRMGGTLPHQTPLVVSAALRFESRLAMMDACFARTLMLAEELGKLPGIRVNPQVPQTNMLHIHFDAAADQVMAARDAIAAERGYWVVNRVAAAEVPGWSFTELNVGDNLLGRSNDEVLPYFAKLRT